MAKKGQVNSNEKKAKLISKFKAKRDLLLLAAHDKKITLGERFQAFLKLSELPRNSAPNRYRNRCKLTGRARGYYKKFGISRIELRRLASFGIMPGVTKSSW